MKKRLLFPLVLMCAVSFAQEPVTVAEAARAARARAESSHRKVLTEADLGAKAGNVRKETWGMETIPGTKLSVMIPYRPGDPEQNVNPYKYPVSQKRDIVVFLGPHISRRQCGYDMLLCAGFRLLRNDLRIYGVIQSAGVELFTTTTTVDGYPARIIDFRVPSDAMRGKLLIVQVPTQAMAATCVYREQDFDPGEVVCDDVISSARVQVPEHFKRQGSIEWVR